MSKVTHLLWLLAIAWQVCPINAQVDRATLNGRVSESGGSGLPDVNIEVVSRVNGLRRTAKTNAAGVYQVPGLPIGKYTVAFSRVTVQVLLMDLAFQPVHFDNIELFVGENRTLDVQMKLGVQDAETPPEADSGRERSTVALGKVILPDQIENLPLNGRNWSGLMTLAPGSLDRGQGTQASIVFIGRSVGDNNWTLDGIDSTGVKQPTQEAQLRLVISSDAIAEFRVNTMLYGAESGTAQGAQIDIASKSGSNDPHGSLFEFFRNEKLDARDPLATDRQPFRMNQFGGNFGGPMKRNRSFFYANYEGLRQNLTKKLAGLVPSSSLRELAFATSPVLKPILDAYPKGFRGTPDANIDDYNIDAAQTWREDSGLLRLDDRWSAATTAFARYNVDDAVIVQPLNALLDRRTSDLRTSNVVTELQHVFSPNVTSEVRLGMNRSAIHTANARRLVEGLNVPGLTGFGSATCSTCTNARTVDAGTSYSLIQSIVVIRGRITWRTGSDSPRSAKRRKLREYRDHLCQPRGFHTESHR
jgi:hypothetical protein